MNDFLNRRNGHVPDPDPQIEDKLRTAMHDQADRFEPQSDAYVRLQQRLENQAAPLSSRSSSGPRLMAMAAAVLAIFGMAGYFSLQSKGQQLATDIPAAEHSSEAATEEIDASEASNDSLDIESAVVETSSSFRIHDGLIAAAPSDNPVDAAIAFLSLVRLDHDYQLELDGNEVLVFANNDQGVKSGLVTTLEVAARSTGSGSSSSDSTGAGSQEATGDAGSITAAEDGELEYFVVKATEPSIVINNPGASRITDSVYTASGIATGWPQGMADLRLYSSNDGALLRTASPDVGAGSSVSEFEVDVQLDGRDHGWIVVQTTSPDGDALGAFAAVPIFYDAPLNSIEYQVAHIDVDDADGLIVRALPGSEEKLRDSLPPETSGIHRRGGIPNFGPEGSLEWWLIEYGDGQTGWVNARYLVSVEDVSDDDLIDTADEFLVLLGDPETATDALLWPADDRKPVEIGWVRDLEDTYATELSDPEWWTDQGHEWTLPPAAGDTTAISSLRDFIGFGEATLAIEPTLERTWVYGQDQQAATSHFAGLSSVTISVASADGTSTGDSAQKTVTLYVESMDGRPVVVGIAIWMWEP